MGPAADSVRSSGAEGTEVNRIDEPYTRADFLGEEPMPPEEAEARRQAAERNNRPATAKPKLAPLVSLAEFCQQDHSLQ